MEWQCKTKNFLLNQKLSDRKELNPKPSGKYWYKVHIAWTQRNRYNPIFVVNLF